MSLKQDYDWDTFAEHAGKAFWANAYMDEVENLVEGDEYYDRDAYHALAPGPGEDWFDYLPPTPKSAEVDGIAFTKALRKKITEAQLREVDEKLPSVEQAGHYAAMQAMGHGVGWFDYSVRADPDIDWGPSVDVLNDAYDTVKAALRERGIRPKKRSKR
jgi:hypothetical protein